MITWPTWLGETGIFCNTVVWSSGFVLFIERLALLDPIRSLDILGIFCLLTHFSDSTPYLQSLPDQPSLNQMNTIKPKQNQWTQVNPFR